MTHTVGGMQQGGQSQCKTCVVIVIRW